MLVVNYVKKLNWELEYVICVLPDDGTTGTTPVRPGAMAILEARQVRGGKEFGTCAKSKEGAGRGQHTRDSGQPVGEIAFGELHRC